MNPEELLTRTLAEEAERREVDVAALHQEVLRRLPQTRRRTSSPLLIAAAVGVLAAGTVGGVVLLDDDEDGAIRYTDTADGNVSVEFGCPHVNTIDFRTTEDDGFLPDLSKGASPADVARAEGAATHDFTTDGDRATLRLGNKDGSLGSITTYALVDGAWQMRTARVCAGAGDLPLTPKAEGLRLGEHGVEPWPAGKLFTDVGLPAGFVDDRPYYNLAGVIEGHRSMYVRPGKGGGWFWISGTPHDMLIGGRLAPSAEIGRPHDLSGMLFDPDMMVGRENPFALWAYDVAGPGEFTALLADGSEVKAKEVSHPEWDGRRMLVILAVRADVETLQFADPSGAVTTWPSGEIPQE